MSKLTDNEKKELFECVGLFIQIAQDEPDNARISKIAVDYVQAIYDDNVAAALVLLATFCNHYNAQYGFTKYQCYFNDYMEYYKFLLKKFAKQLIN